MTTDITELAQLKPGNYAILYRDNWDGEKNEYHTLAVLTEEGGWYDVEFNAELLKYQGDKILKVWPMDDSSNVLAQPAPASEPVFFIEVEGDDWINAGRIEGKNRPDLGLLPDGINYLYATPQPAPVVLPEQHWEELCRQYPDMSIGDAIIRAAWWNRCRAAMLPGKADGTLISEGTKLPATQIKPVADLYGITSPTGSETSFTFDAIEARNFIDGGWSCQEYVELERYQQACTDNSPAIPGAEQRIADAVELLKRAAPAMLADNSGPDGPLVGKLKYPVILDGSKEALSEAVAAIYFTDSTDYLPALFSVVSALSPEVFSLLLSNQKAAFDATRLPAAPQEVRGD